MRKFLYHFIYTYILGWKYKVTVPEFNKCVICAAPHTANSDLFIGKLFFGNAFKGRAHFLMKKEWFFFPLGVFFRSVGGIPVDRKHKTSLTQQMTAIFASRDEFHLAITPEGTRSANPKWKKGFYYIALDAKVPIVLIGIDYAKKTITAGKYIIPNGDYDAQLAEIKQYYTQFTAKHPERFAI
jgi:1-acyl-sn-glycerol-3-phosphate acyltransferase